MGAALFKMLCLTFQICSEYIYVNFNFEMLVHRSLLSWLCVIVGLSWLSLSWKLFKSLCKAGLLSLSQDAVLCLTSYICNHGQQLVTMATKYATVTTVTSTCVMSHATHSPTQHSSNLIMIVTIKC